MLPADPVLRESPLPRRAIAAAFLGSSLLVAQDETWWAYRPLQRPDVPAVADTAWPRTDLDRFVLAGLEAAGLRPAPPLDRGALLRRVTFDLIGLPPTPAETAAFLADTAPDAYERVVDRLLGSPQYGVKWGRHWLDLVRWAETDSFERDNKKPNAWRYRDWVVDALNRDLPWGEFLQKQLAGDELPAAGAGDVIATGYYRLGIWDDEPTDPLQAIYDDLDGIVDTTGRAMLGMSLGCARCHDHKKDPITAEDYWSFLAFFEHLRPYRPPQGGSGLSPENYVRHVPADGAVARHDAAVAEYEGKRAALFAEVERASAQAWRTASPARRVAAIRAADRSLVARYSGDRSAAERLVDDLGGRHGEVQGQVVPVPGRSGGAMKFDGDDRVHLPRLVEDSFTVSFWVRSSERGRGRAGDTRWFTGSGLVDGEVDGVVRDWGIAWHGDGRLVAGTGDPETFVASPRGYADGTWHHVAFTRDRQSGRIALHVDGELVGAAEGSKSRLDAPPRLCVGGLQPGGHGFRGELDELCFFDRALAPSEVIGLAAALPGGLAAAGLVEATAPATGAGRAFAEFAALQRPVLETMPVLCAQELDGEPAQGHVRLRGNVHALGPAVVPRVPAVLGGSELAIERPAGARGSGRRTALARWITSPDNPLTWRVIANRLVQHHLGRGLSRSPNDFGRLGEAPTHPELLDWLACELLARGQSLKAMHRLLVTSATYAMGSMPSEAQSAADPRNDRFWRIDRRRLQAEELRDAMLAVNGTLNPALGGPGVFPPMPSQVLATASRPDEAWGESPPAEAARRSIYIHVKRSLVEPLLSSFDLADTDTSCPVRFSTVQPTQALMLLNGDFAQRQATLFAERLAREAADLRAQLALGLRLVTCRDPVEAEVGRLAALCDDLQKQHGRSPAEALQRACLLLYNCNEFLYVD
jgi:hypothetical protein